MPESLVNDPQGLLLSLFLLLELENGQKDFCCEHMQPLQVSARRGNSGS